MTFSPFRLRQDSPTTARTGPPCTPLSSSTSGSRGRLHYHRVLGIDEPR